MQDFIPLSVPNLNGNELKYVTEAIQTGWVSSVGSFVHRFENEFAKYIGVKYAVSTVNGTAALHISLLLCGVQQGDEVLVPNLTFIAPVNAVRYCNAFPVFMDVEWKTFGIDVEKVKDFLKKECTLKNGYACNKTSGNRVKAIIPVHVLGYPVNIEELKMVCQPYNVGVIEDATESLGSEFKGRKTGTFGKVNCFSFNGNKIMTTGGGGMIATDDEQLAVKAKHLTTTAKTDPVYFDHDQIGFNYRLVNVLAAIGVAQLEQMDQFVAVKRKNFLTYNKKLEGLRHFALHHEPLHVKSNYWMYALVCKEEARISMDEIIPVFTEHKIQVRPLWKLMNKLPMFQKHQSYYCTNSENIQKRVLNIPSSTNLKEEDIDRVSQVIKKIEEKYK